jgi:hypothetical protein
MTYDEVKRLKPTAFKRFCGVKPHTFAAMIKALRAREAQKKKPGRTADLCLEDQPLLALQYWREYRTYFHLSVSWGVSEATVSRIVRRVEDILIKTRQFHLPGKKALRGAAHHFQVVVVDVTETPVERPKKTAALLQRQKEAPHAEDPVGG